MGTDKKNSGNRVILRKLLCLLTFFIFCSFLTLPLLAEDQTVFGPEDLRIGGFHVHFSFHTFEAIDAKQGIIAITKNTPDKTIHGGFLYHNKMLVTTYIHKGYETRNECSPPKSEKGSPAHL